MQSKAEKTRKKNRGDHVTNHDQTTHSLWGHLKERGKESYTIITEYFSRLTPDTQTQIEEVHRTQAG